ncbi:hypothetical protein KEM54_002658 [Ascosphaera aggregata]|nr:hypothetical protein KEM54_002658 [Ascosphaera aggregata]
MSHPSPSITTPVKEDDDCGGDGDGGGDDDDARAENAALIADLREQVKKAETVSDQYRKQLGVLQLKLDEAVSEQTRLEEAAHSREDTITVLQGEIKELARRVRDLDQAQAAERSVMAKDKEEQIRREEELQATIQRLKETISQRESRKHEDTEREPRFCETHHSDEGQLSPSSDVMRSSSRSSNSKLLLQKDKIIESLRMEVAASQVKIEELQNVGGGRLHELEKQLLEARTNNARLLEDNESYQLLLSERALKGHFNGNFAYEQASKRLSTGTQDFTNLGSLADELESVENGTVDMESYRRLETENKNLKDQCKALTLYIEKIIGRLLQHDGYESILAKNEDDTATPAPESKNPDTDKDIPPSPTLSDVEESPSLKQGFTPLNSDRIHNPKLRATSITAHQPENPETFENPATAPRITFKANRVRNMHRRARSDQVDPAAATVIGHMYRGPLSPTLSSPLSQQGFSFSSATTSMSNTPGNRTSFQSSVTSRSDRRFSETPSLRSERTGDVTSAEGASPPRSLVSMNNYPGAVTTQNKLRPLRLVQEDEAAVAAARKKANRGSWISWFKKEEGQTAQG